MKNILPIAYPSLDSYPLNANILSVLCAYKKESSSWLSDHFIQLVVDNEGEHSWKTNFYDLRGANKIFSNLYCPFLKSVIIDREILDPLLTDFTTFIEEQINKGFYFHIRLDCFYLSCSEYFKKSHGTTHVFIYGYDHEAEEITLSGFFDGKYCMKKTVKYNEINNSYLLDFNKYPKVIQYRMFKYRDYNYKFDVNLLKLFINDYVNCKDSFLKYAHAFDYQNSETYFGLDTYNMLIEKFEFQDDGDFKILYDHKVLMMMRLGYLKDNEYISSNSFNLLTKQCEDILSKSMELHNMVLKYDTGKEAVIAKEIKNKTLLLRQIDKEFMIRIHESLS